jgi:hypothetical protein
VGIAPSTVAAGSAVAASIAFTRGARRPVGINTFDQHEKLRSPRRSKQSG